PEGEGVMRALAKIVLILAGLSTSHAEDGFQSIFNGTNLDGWDSVEGAWAVRDGVIHCTGEMKKKNWLIWRKEQPDDFVLRLEFKFIKGNSGVQVRSLDLGEHRVRGYQVEVAAQSKMGLWHHSLAPHKSRSHLATAGQKVHIAADGTKTTEQVAAPSTVQAAYREGDWNALEVTAEGPRLIQKINGVVFADLTDEEKAYATRSGFIALQDHGKGTRAAFRNIRLKHLD
ncbi:MAG: DUF1080 domain-containing protein, partial [Verrucomicrobiota bacterium]